MNGMGAGMQFRGIVCVIPTPSSNSYEVRSTTV